MFKNQFIPIPAVLAVASVRQGAQTNRSVGHSSFHFS
jgi:hypothetical protein